MAHDPGCFCSFCRSVRAEGVEITQADRDCLAIEWGRWVGTNDGEVEKLRAGENGNPCSPRWVALQAIARARLALTR